MKKLLAIVLVLALAMSIGVTAFAQGAPETVGQNGSKEIDVIAGYNTTTSTPEVYSVDIVWTDMTFTYTESSTKTWNADDHSYDTTASGGWDKTTASVTVTNHSNVEVAVAMEYVPVENTGVTGTLTGGNAVLSAGEEGNYSLTATLTIGGKPSETVTTDGVKIGTIKVTIS